MCEKLMRGEKGEGGKEGKTHREREGDPYLLPLLMYTVLEMVP